jgi:hypothetical protein
MPKGPNGQKRPADVIGAAVLVGRIATGEIDDVKDGGGATPKAAPQRKGGVVRAKRLSPERRSEIARRAAAIRWAAKSD